MHPCPKHTLVPVPRFRERFFVQSDTPNLLPKRFYRHLLRPPAADCFCGGGTAPESNGAFRFCAQSAGQCALRGLRRLNARCRLPAVWRRGHRLLRRVQTVWLCLRHRGQCRETNSAANHNGSPIAIAENKRRNCPVRPKWQSIHRQVSLHACPHFERVSWRVASRAENPMWVRVRNGAGNRQVKRGCFR